MLTAYTSPAATMTSATYNGDGIRATSTTGTSNIFTWGTSDDATSQLLMDSANAYIYEKGSTPVEQVSLASGTVTYLDTDSLGSVRGLVSSTGALTAATSYDAWGNPQTSGGLTSSTPFGYAGGYTDPTGLIYLINHYYDPRTGQFISVDPGIAQTLQPYAYTDGNPVSQSDPTGQCSKYDSTGCTIPITEWKLVWGPQRLGTGPHHGEYFGYAKNCGAAWNASKSTQTVYCQEEVDISVSVSWGFNLALDKIGDTANFSTTVTVSVGHAYGFYWNAAPNTQGWLQLGLDYWRWKAGIQGRQCQWSPSSGAVTACGKPGATQWVYSNQYDGHGAVLCVRVYGSGKECDNFSTSNGW